MNWTKATNIAIIIFIILNIFLNQLIIDKNKRLYVLSDKRIERVKNILQKEQINFFKELISKYYPMSSLKIAYYSPSAKKLSDKILGKNETVKTYIEEDKILCEKNNEKLLIYKDGLITYMQQITGGNNEITTKEQAINTTEEFIKKLNYFKNYKLDNIYQKEGKVFLTYYETYKNQLILNSYINFQIKYNQIEQVNMYLVNIKGFSDAKKDVYPPDEVLVNFIYNVKQTKPNISIIDYSLGYYIEEKDIDKSIVNTLLPYYKIILNDNSIYYINAYTNELIN